MIGSAILYSVFVKIHKENGMPAKIMVSRTDHTPPDPACTGVEEQCPARTKGVKNGEISGWSGLSVLDAIDRGDADIEVACYRAD